MKRHQMNQCVMLEPPNNDQYWVAKLELGFKKVNNRTILAHRKHKGPIRVQKMLWPEKTPICHAIIVHPPAGIAGGDHISFQVHSHAHSHALVTTPGAGKWYKTNQKLAFQQIELTVDEHAVLEWLPQETMLFNGACAHSTTRINLASSASFIGWDMLVLGRQAAHEVLSEGQYHNHFQLYQNHQLLVADRLNFSGGDRWLSSILGMNHKAVMGSFWVVAPETYRHPQLLEQQLAQIRDLIMRMDIHVTLTLLDHVITARYLGDDVRECHDAFAAIRAKLRRYWFDLDEEFPRIWRT